MSTLQAYREQMAHTHRYVEIAAGLEACTCGSVRAIHPDDR